MMKLSASADYQRNRREKNNNDQYHYWCGRDDAFSHVVEYLMVEIEKLEAQP